MNKVAVFTIYYIYLKLFLALIGPIIYIEYPEGMGLNIIIDNQSNTILNIIVTLYSWVVYDLFWFFPFTIMNSIFFIALISYKDNTSITDAMSYLLLKMYAIWILIYILSTYFSRSINEHNIGSLFSGPYSPYGILTIVYFLLGNFTFIFLFKFSTKFIYQVNTPS